MFRAGRVYHPAAYLPPGQAVYAAGAAPGAEGEPPAEAPAEAEKKDEVVEADFEIVDDKK